jgi:hypothetical protein
MELVRRLEAPDPLWVPDLGPLGRFSPDPGLCAFAETSGHGLSSAGSPGHPASSPGHPASSPGHPASSPGQRASSPRLRASSPGDPASSPGHAGSSSGQAEASGQGRSGAELRGFWSLGRGGLGRGL